MYDIINNPIPKSGLFATPDNFEQLTAVLQNLSPGERALVYPYVMMTLNTCNKIVEEEILSKEVFGQ